MMYKNTPCSEQLRYKFINEHLQSSFCNSSIVISNNQIIAREQLTDIYQQSYDSIHDNIWFNYNNMFTLEEVITAINELDDRKDPGPMNIESKYLKFNIQIIAPIILSICNAILDTGHIPPNWKDAYITPIPKKGVTTDISNYRGIAMQSTIPKIFDKLLTQKRAYHIDIILPHQQHGFRSKRSTTTNLSEISSYIHSNYYGNNQVDVVYFDFSKAFDRVDYYILATKLCKLSMPFLLYMCVMNFIINRQYQLKCDNKIHDFKFKINSSVPQGSHCGPLLFTIMTMDIVQCIQNTSVKLLLYADDTKIYNLVNNDASRLELQNVIDKLTKWSITNKLPLNYEKTYHLTFSKNKCKYLSYHITLVTNALYNKKKLKT